MKGKAAWGVVLAALTMLLLMVIWLFTPRRVMMVVAPRRPLLGDETRRDGSRARVVSPVDSDARVLSRQKKQSTLTHSSPLSLSQSLSGSLAQNSNTASETKLQVKDGGVDEDSREGEDLQPPATTMKNKRRLKFILVSFVSNNNKNNNTNDDGDEEFFDYSPGMQLAAKSRACYAKMHGYEDYLFSDEDLVGWIPDSSSKSGGNKTSSSWGPPLRRHAGYRSQRHFNHMWSKNFIMRRMIKTVMNRTFHNNSMHKRDAAPAAVIGDDYDDTYILWLDADVMITRPKFSLEEIVDSVVVDDTSSSKRLPDLIVSNNVHSVNNGVFMMRATNWSLSFLDQWWLDQNANRHAWDNGPFMSALLREMAASVGVKYKNECRTKTKATYEDGQQFLSCYRNYVFNTILNGMDPYDSLSRCKYFSPQQQQQQQRRKEQKDKDNNNATTQLLSSYALKDRKRTWDFGFVLRYRDEKDFRRWHHRRPHVAGFCHMNDGLGPAWEPVSVFSKKSSFLVHLAGRSKEFRNNTFLKLGSEVRHRFRSAKCDF